MRMRVQLRVVSKVTWRTEKGKLAFIKLSKLINGVVSEETVVLGRWGSSIQKFGVDNVN